MRPTSLTFAGLDITMLTFSAIWIDPLWEEPRLPIAERETYEPVPASGCPRACAYGECGAPGTTMGCGGCCSCLRGCALLWEQQQSAPLLWTGDSA